MSSLVIALTLVCVLAISTGQLLFKKAAQAMPDVLSLSALLHNGWLIASLVLYGVTTLGWVWILRHAPLHLAYPFMGLAFLIVPTLAWAFLGEPLGWRTLAGVFPRELFGTLVLTNYIFKVSIEVVMTPATYAVVAFLKRAESEDYYDRHTRFNPFGI